MLPMEPRYFCIGGIVSHWQFQSLAVVSLSLTFCDQHEIKAIYDLAADVEHLQWVKEW